eukprot:gene1047-10566_t
MSKFPKVQWAQRKEYVFVTVDIQDAKNLNVELADEGKIKFSCEDQKGQKFAFEFDLSNEIVKDESSWASKGRSVDIALKKKKSDIFWEKLQAGKKLHYVSVDWSKWVEEDEEEALEDNSAFDMQQQMAQMQQMQQMQQMGMGGGMPGMGGMGGMPGMSGMPGMEGLMSQMGGLGGMGGMESKSGDKQDEEDEMPPLDEVD